MLSLFRADPRELTDGEEVNSFSGFAKSPSRESELSQSFRSITQIRGRPAHRRESEISLEDIALYSKERCRFRKSKLEGR